MKKFLQTAFKITPFQIIAIALLASLKYILTTYNIIDKIEKPFVWLCLGMGVIFVLAVGIMGIIENRGQSFEEWKSQARKSPKEKVMASFASWGVIIPSVLAFVLFLYIITPTSIYMVIALYAGIVIRNCIEFLSSKQRSKTQ